MVVNHCKQYLPMAVQFGLHFLVSPLLRSLPIYDLGLFFVFLFYI